MMTIERKQSKKQREKKAPYQSGRLDSINHANDLKLGLHPLWQLLTTLDQTALVILRGAWFRRDKYLLPAFVPLDSTGFHWIPLDCTGLRVSLSEEVKYIAWVELGITFLLSCQTQNYTQLYTLIHMHQATLKSFLATEELTCKFLAVKK
jgi:hypothetical protein